MKTQKYNLKWLYNLSKAAGLRHKLFLLQLAVFLKVLASLSVAFLLMLFIDLAMDVSNFTMQETIIITATILFLSGLVSFAGSYLHASYIGKLEFYLREKILKHLFGSDFLQINKFNTAELNTRLTEDIRVSSEIFPKVLNDAVGGVTLVLFAIISLFFLSWQTALVFFIAVPLIMAILSLSNIPMGKIDKSNKINEENARNQMHESLGAITLIRVYFAEKFFLSRLTKAFTNRYRSQVKFGTLEGFAVFVNELLSSIMLIILLGVGAIFVLQGLTTVGMLMAMVQLMDYVLEPLSRVSKTFTDIAKARVSAERIGELFELDEAQKLPNLADTDILFDELKASNLSFYYEQDKYIFNNLNFTAKTGEIIGIIGQSGVGKSTLLKVLLGLYEPKTGDILLKNTSTETKNILPYSAYVSSEKYVFAGSILENICINDADEYDKNKLTKILELTNLTEFINSLENGINTVIEEAGDNISSGQAQRIALARAMYKNSKVLVLDEPTSNLDADSRNELKATLKNISHDKICIVVSHDNNLMDIFDKTFIFEDSKLLSP